MMNKPSLKFRNKLAFACGAMGTSMFDRVRSVYTSPFLLDVVGMNGYYVGIILLVSRAWDAVTDPLIGHLSDTTKSKYGRRRSWILFSSIPLLLSYIAIWWIPPHNNENEEGVLIFYFFLMILIFETCSTAAKIPHDCLMAEMGDTSDDATILSQWRYFAATATGLAASMIQALIIDANEDSKREEERAYLFSSFLWVLFAAPMIAVCYFGTFEDPKNSYRDQLQVEANDETSPLIQSESQSAAASESNLKGNDDRNSNPNSHWKEFFSSIREIVQYQPFVWIVLAFVSTLALEFVQSNTFLYVKYVLKEDTAVLFYIQLYQTIARLVSIPLWTKLARQIGKKKALLIGFGLMIVIQLLYFPLGSGDLHYYYILTPLRGAAGSAPVLLIYSMVSDVIDLDEFKSGKRREGIFFSFLVFLQKLAISIALAVSSFYLAAAGYKSDRDDDNSGDSDYEEDRQNNQVLFALTLMSSVIPAVILAMGMASASMYSLSKEEHEEIKQALNYRRQSNLIIT